MGASHSRQRQEAAARTSYELLHPRPIDVTEVLAGLSSSEAETVMKMTRDQSYAPRTHIYSLGEHQQGLYVAKTGLIEEFRITESGNKLPITRIVPGQLFGLSSVNTHYCCFAEAIEESVVGFLSFDKLEIVCRNHPSVVVKLVELLARRLGEIEERVELLAFSGLRARVAWALLGLYAVHGSRLVGVTHEALATWAASSRPKVSQVLGELQQAGVLRLSRSAIEVSDPGRLEEWAKQVSIAL
ncbi:MAG: Crp/Fnr family transcriptional regulator [Dehalococcoidia bacterium]